MIGVNILYIEKKRKEISVGKYPDIYLAILILIYLYVLPISNCIAVSKQNCGLYFDSNLCLLCNLLLRAERS